MRILWLGLIVAAEPFFPCHFLSPCFLQPIENKGFIEIVTISKLLQTPSRYHQKPIRVRGTVTRLELHLDDSKHFIKFVFYLDNRVLVFGEHDRTMGDIQMTTGRTVEVQGIFWKEREANGYRLFNQIEADRVTFHPPLLPDSAALPGPPNNRYHASARKLSGVNCACCRPRTSWSLASGFPQNRT